MQVSIAVMYLSHGSYLPSFTFIGFVSIIVSLAHPSVLFNVGIRAN